MKVARRYKFRASHYLPGVKGYDKPHEHDYTVEVVMEGEPRDGMVIDTALLDAVWNNTSAQLEGRDLNFVYTFPTTVENLADRFLQVFSYADGEDGLSIKEGLSVTVWEDDDRWGQAP